jgi:hypothetical protein
VTTEEQLVRDRPVARLHVIALRASPFILWLLSLYLILVGTLGGKPEAESITMMVLGAVIAVTGAVITRAESLKFGKEGRRGNHDVIAGAGSRTLRFDDLYRPTARASPGREFTNRRGGGGFCGRSGLDSSPHDRGRPPDTYEDEHQADGPLSVFAWRHDNRAGAH